jgi:hypothetical protein
MVGSFLTAAGNFGVPLAVLALYLCTDSTKKQWCKPCWPRLEADRHVVVVARVLQVSTVLFLLGHAGLALAQRKQLLGFHMGILNTLMGSHASAPSLLRLSGLIDASLALAALCCPASIIFLLALGWKLVIESLYPLSGDYLWEFIERFGSYIAPSALVVMARAYPSQVYRHCSERAQLRPMAQHPTPEGDAAVCDAGISPGRVAVFAHRICLNPSQRSRAIFPSRPQAADRSISQRTPTIGGHDDAAGPALFPPFSHAAGIRVAMIRSRGFTGG